MTEQEFIDTAVKDQAARAMLAALKLVQEASRQELNSPRRQELMGKALPMVRAAIAQAEAAGIE